MSKLSRGFLDNKTHEQITFYFNVFTNVIPLIENHSYFSAKLKIVDTKIPSIFAKILPVPVSPENISVALGCITALLGSWIESPRVTSQTNVSTKVRILM